MKVFNNSKREWFLIGMVAGLVVANITIAIYTAVNV